MEWGGGGRAGLKHLWSRAAARKIFLTFLGGSGVWGLLKIKYLRLAKNAFPKIFQLIFLVSQKNEMPTLNHYLEKSERFKRKIPLKQSILYRSPSRGSKNHS